MTRKTIIAGLLTVGMSALVGACVSPMGGAGSTTGSDAGAAASGSNSIIGALTSQQAQQALSNALVIGCGITNAVGLVDVVASATGTGETVYQVAQAICRAFVPSTKLTASRSTVRMGTRGVTRPVTLPNGLTVRVTADVPAT